MNELNDNKAGMAGLDKERINAIIAESTGAQFDVAVKRKERRTNERILLQRRIVDRLTDAQKTTSRKQMDELIATIEHGRQLGSTHIHVDMDAFYAAVEMRDAPALRAVPMAVGGDSMLATSNYLARRYGVRAGMPGFIAMRLCPHLVIVPGAMHKYATIAAKVRDILAEFDPEFQSGGLDEAYLDVTACLTSRRTMSEQTPLARRRYSGACPCRLPRLDASADAPLGVQQRPSTVRVVDDSMNVTASECSTCGREQTRHTDMVTFECTPYGLAEQIRFRIEQRTGLTASAGVAANGMLAKICSDMNKPNSQYLLEPDADTIREFMLVLNIRKIHGIGSVSGALLDALGVTVAGDILAQRALLPHIYSPTTTAFLVHAALGAPQADNRDENTADRKSISVSRTFAALTTEADMVLVCDSLCAMLAKDIAEKGVKGRTVTLSVKTSDFTLRTRAHTVAEPSIHSEEQLCRVMRLLLKEELHANGGRLSLRLLGVRLSNLVASTTATASLTPFVQPMASMADTPSCSTDQATVTPRTVGDMVDFVCPVCRHRWPPQQPFTDTAVSRHIDACLSRRTIRHCVQEENAKATHMSAHHKSGTRKRAAPTSAGHRSMERFVVRTSAASSSSHTPST